MVKRNLQFFVQKNFGFAMDCNDKFFEIATPAYGGLAMTVPLRCHCER